MLMPAGRQGSNRKVECVCAPTCPFVRITAYSVHMDSERAAAYGRVAALVEAESGVTLSTDEAAKVRTAADALFFSEEGANEAVEAVRGLVRSLVESERWSEERSQLLLDDVLQCGSLILAV